MKVLLFVQNGDARPKSYASVSRYAIHPSYPRLGDTRWCVTGKPAQRALSAADRWWLVECENAENGRRVIEDARLGLGNVDDAIAAGPGSLAGPRVGRILASGGHND